MRQLILNLPDAEMERLQAEAERQNLAPEALALDLLRRSIAAGEPTLEASSSRAERLQRIRGELSQEYADLFERLAG
jgi:hypothetical protein